MKNNNYYHRDLDNLINFIIPKSSQTYQVNIANGKISNKPKKDHEYILLNNIIGDLTDIQQSLNSLLKYTTPQSRLMITYYNHLWEPLLKFASLMGWRREVDEQNWLDDNDLINLLDIAGFEVITLQRRLLLPFYLPLISNIINGFFAHLPIINNFCLTKWLVARPKPIRKKQYSVSIVIPSRNEEGNISKIIPQIPKFGKSQEIIFIEGHSIDKTWQVIKGEANKKHTNNISVLAFQQKGIGKADAVRLGFSKASGELLMILDADLSVDPKDLVKFYQAISAGLGEFANGSRLVYPMEKEAMRMLNKAGNKVFSYIFSWILGQRFKDTLCGTKVLLKSDYEKIVQNRKMFGDFDPFGDFDLIFGAVKLNHKVIEIPVKYRERVYGSTNISRFKHGLLLAKMTVFAFRKFRF